MLVGLVVWCAGAPQAQAVALGKIEVTSHLGEPFFGVVPLRLAPGEAVQNVFVEIASPEDYRILEIYRDPVVNTIRVDVENDTKGPRVELSSRLPIDAPFFNLVLKVRHKRVTHFKKFPVFLDLPKALRPEPSALPQPVVRPVAEAQEAGQAAPVSMAPAAAAAPAKTEAAPAPAFKPFDGWARIGRYGPMVYGDTITTVAQRLRIDDRYTLQQVMVALFLKNRAKFGEDNINIIKAGTYLDVPTAAEVEKVTPAYARQLIAEHEKRWAELKRQPRYAALAEAQRTRYSKRVRIGRRAEGRAAAPVSGAKAAAPSAASERPLPAKEQAPSEVGAAGGGATVSGEGGGKADRETRALIEQLKAKNAELSEKLAESEKRIAQLEAKSSDAALAAQEARIKKLQLRLARLQAELDKARAQAAAGAESGFDWLTAVLGGLVVILLGVVGILIARLRSQPKHPADFTAPAPAPEAPAEAAAAAAAPAVAEEEEVEEIEVEEADVSDLEKTRTIKTTAEEAPEFTDSIPDLTDEDTGSMEPFVEEEEEEPDPNVDYLAEADVYMRYGMEDEALHQVNLAMKLNPEKADVHIKKAQILKAKGDEEAFQAAVAEAEERLAGSELESFKSAVAELSAEGREIDSGELEDTLPPTTAEAMIGEELEASGETLDLGEEDTIVHDTEAELEDELSAAIIDTSGGGEDTVSLDEALAELEGGEEPAAASETEASGEEAGGEMLDLDFDLGETGGEKPEEEEAEQEAESEEKPEQEPAPGEEAGVSEPEASLEDTAGLDFDLSDIELPEGEAEEAPAKQPEIATADLDKTVAMDWSRDTSNLDELETEPPKQASDLDLGELDLSGTAEAGESAAEETQEFTDSLRLDAGDLGGEVEAKVEDEVSDDFTSTIQTSVERIQEEGGDVDFTATGEFDLGGEESEEGTAGEAKASSADEDDVFELDLDEDVDATQKLDSLLSEFTDEDEDKDKG